MSSLWQDLWRYNTQVVLLGTVLLGVSGGLVGSFLVLRKRALAADVVSHAALPGIAIAFLLAERLSPGSGRHSGLLLLGAFLSGLLGMGCTLAIRRWTRIKDDAALAIVLGLFFGIGMALFTVVQRTRTGNAAGLQHFIFGKAATLVASDVWLIAAASAITVLLCVLFFKELSLLCFDEEFAVTQGRRTKGLDWLLTLMVVTVTLVGLQSVGMLLVVALLLIPSTSARFWTHDLRTLTWLASLIGGLSCAGGVLLSAMFPRLAAGAVIVLTGSAFFLVSLFFGRERGLVLRWWERRRMELHVGRSDLLRACYEYLEPLLIVSEESNRASIAGGAVQSSLNCSDALQRHVIPRARLAEMRHWSESKLRPLLRSAETLGLLNTVPGGWQLTASGAQDAQRAARQHRLWEIYLLTQTDLDPRLADRGADGIEHVLDAEELQKLQSQLDASSIPGIPPSPHPIRGSASRDSTPVGPTLSEC